MKKFKRIILKISGETFGNATSATNLDFEKIDALASGLKQLLKQQIEVGVVVGAGNIFRGRMIEQTEIDRVAADHMGMMATIINALALHSVLDKHGLESRVLSAISMPEIAENYVHKRAINHLANGRIGIFAGGTGRPYFTTDTTSILRALEVKAEVVLKASNVDGVYDADPKKNKNAKKYDTLSYDEALEKHLDIMDATAFALARENKMPIIVFKFSPENLLIAAEGKTVGTLIS